jgi:uncharacterized membrane protein YedE/YeeE
MGAAIATATIGTRLLKAARARARVDGTPVTWRTLKPTRSHVIGSAIFGLGWSLSNACPGPVAVQLGRGEWSALFTALGLMAGIALRDAIAARTAARTAPLAPAVESGMCEEPGAARA